MIQLNKIELFGAFISLFFLIECTQPKKSKDEKEINSAKSIDSAQERVLLKIKADISYGKYEFKAASGLYFKLISLDSADNDAIYRYAFCNSQLGEDSIAIKYFLKSIKSNYKLFGSNYSLGLIYFSHNNNKAATKYFKKCLEIKKDDKEVKHFLDIIYKSQGKNNL